MDDICWRENGFYFDVVESTDKTWSAMYNNQTLKSGFMTRDEAKEWLNNPQVRQEFGIAQRS